MYFGRLSRWGRRAGVFEKEKGVSEEGRKGVEWSGVDCSNKKEEKKKKKRKEHHRLGEEEEEREGGIRPLMGAGR